MNWINFITGASGGGLLGLIIGISIKHFLDLTREKQIFKQNFKKEFYFRRLDKAIELLKLIDDIKYKLTLYELKQSENIDRNYLEIKDYLENKSSIINLSLCYFPELKENINDYDIAIETFQLLKNIYKIGETFTDYNEETIYNNKKFNENLNNSLKLIEEILEKLKTNISNYLLEQEKNI